MRFVTPKVYKVAETKLLNEGVLAWLTDLGGEECLAHVTGDDKEKLIEFAGRRCYKSFKEGLNPNVTKIRKDSDLYHENVLKSGHGSILEHASVSYAFENVSRVFTHEAVRHRAGVAISQESLRYVRLTDMGFWVPEVFKSQGEEKYAKALEILTTTVKQCEKAQKDLSDLFEIETMTDFNKKKALTSAFRRVAPDGLATGILLTFNFRALRHVLTMRTGRHAEEELRLTFGQVAEMAIRDYPAIFGDFEKIDTGDGLFEYKPKFEKV